jgi:hypothetical protein
MRELIVAIQAGIPVIWWGDPGVGKSSIVNSIGRALGLHVETVIASLREPSDFAGLPIPTADGRVRMAAPEWVFRLLEEGRGVAFLDEISTAPPAVQAALLRMVLDRVVGEVQLPETVAMVAAANPPERAAGGWDLTPPLANRFVHLHHSLDAGAWADGMVSGFPDPTIRPLPEGWVEGIGQSQALVASFIKAAPHHLLKVPDNESQAGKAWPSPRTWQMAARIMAACDAGRESDDVRVALIGGCVGGGTALEFLNWVREMDLPDPELLLGDPASFTVPQRGDQAYAVLTSVVSAVLRDIPREGAELTAKAKARAQQRWLAGWEILNRAAEQGKKDVAASACRALARDYKPDRSILKLPSEYLNPFREILKASGRIA